MIFSRVRALVPLVAFAIFSAASMRAQQVPPARVGIINIQKAVSDTQEIKKAQASLEARYHPRQQAIQTLQQQMQSIQQQLSAPNMTPDKEAQLRAQGTRDQKELQRLGEDLQSDINNERQDILGRAGRQMSDVVKKIAEERGFDVVIEITNTMYFKPALEITAEATAAYDRAYPAK